MLNTGCYFMLTTNLRLTHRMLLDKVIIGVRVRDDNIGLFFPVLDTIQFASLLWPYSSPPLSPFWSDWPFLSAAPQRISALNHKTNCVSSISLLCPITLYSRCQLIPVSLESGLESDSGQGKQHIDWCLWALRVGWSEFLDTLTMYHLKTQHYNSILIAENQKKHSVMADFIPLEINID